MPQSLAEMDAHLRDPNFVHLGQSSPEDGVDPHQLYQGLVGPPNQQSGLFVFPDIIQWLPLTAPIFADGTMKAVKFVIRGQVTQLLVVNSNVQDHVSTALQKHLKFRFAVTAGIEAFGGKKCRGS